MSEWECSITVVHVLSRVHNACDDVHGLMIDASVVWRQDISIWPETRLSEIWITICTDLLINTNCRAKARNIPTPLNIIIG